MTLPATLIFFHVGKTAGRTLGTILARHFAEHEQLNASIGKTRSALGLHRRVHIEAAVHALPPERRGGIRFVRGHVPFGIHELFAAPARYITLLRDPVERVVSSFYYLRQVPQVPIFPLIRDMSFDQYIESRLGLDPYNYQVRVTSGRQELDCEWIDLRPLDSIPVTENHLNQAKRNIEDHFLLAATTERFEEVLVFLRRLYRWRLADLFFRPENVTQGRPRLSELPASTIDRIRTHNVFDHQLYRWVDARFRQTVHSLGLAFRLEVFLFRKLNRRFQRDGMSDDLGRRAERVSALLGLFERGRLVPD